jgi:type IV pilus assembly protein PilA
MNKKQKGFSLIELLIVVAIILIIAAIAIPNLLRSKMAANQASAVGAIRTIVTSQVTYNSTWGVGYGTSLVVLGSPVGGGACTAAVGQACLLDPVLSGGIKSGYNFETAAAGGAGTTASPNVTFETDAWPIQVNQTGTDSYCSDQSGVVRFNTSGAQITDAAGACAAVTGVLQ